jgi:hypothetical protein
MTKKVINKALENIDGYLISIKRNVDTGMYELEVGFRKNWVFKSTDDIECEVITETDNGTLLTINGKHDEVVIDDLIDFVNKVIETNKKITEMQEKFEEELQKKKEELANEIMKFEETIEKYKDSSFEDEEEEKPKTRKSKKTTDGAKKISIEDESVAQKIS